MQITLDAIADGGGVGPNQDITVDLTFTGFDLPDFIADSAIDINSTMISKALPRTCW